MLRFVIITAWIFLLFIPSCSDESDNWDIFDEGLVTMEIVDLSPITIGYDLRDVPSNAIVDEVQIEIEIEHDMPSDLEITAIHEEDSVVLWNNDFPGGRQKVDIDQFIGVTAAGVWDFRIYDCVENGDEGNISRLSFGLNYSSN